MTIPLKGDRGVFDTANYPERHASDLEAAAPTVHNPLPGAAGTVPVSDGSKWVADTPDAGTLSYTPAVLTDWDGDADPGGVDDALDQLAERTDDLENIAIATVEPTGFPNRTASTLTFTAGTLTLSVAPVSGSFTFYSAGTLFTKTTAQEKAIANTPGLHYVYFNTAGVLSEGVLAWDIASANVPVACIYWDGSAGILMDERHGIQMDGRTHEYLHETRGPAFAFGLAGTFAANGSAITIGSGEWYDDDIEHEPGEQTTCRVFWLDGTTWKWTAAQAGYFHTVSSVPQYNNAGALANVGANKYTTSWVFHTNHTTTPVAVIMGQAEYNTQAQAEAAGLPNLASLPAAEMLLLYKVVWQRNGAVITWKSTADYRRTSGGSVANYVATDHGALAGLTDDDHPQYFLETDTQMANYVYAGPESGAATAPTFRALTLDDMPSGIGGGGITDITYADLATAIGASELALGQLYQITDFATVHYIIDADGVRHVATVQVDTVTLSGTAGTAEIYDAGGLTETVTWTTDLPGTAAAFVTAHAAAYLAEGIVVTADGADLIFTANVAGTGFEHPGISNVTDDLTGTIANTTLNDYGLITGPTEPLIVLAIDTNKLHVEAKSARYPQDVIYYDWDPDNWLNDPAFIGDDTLIIPGWTGVITFRHDTVNDNYAPGDWRNCKTRRWETSAAEWDEEAAYSTGDIVGYSNGIYATVVDILPLQLQIDTLTLTGDSGTATITTDVLGGLTVTYDTDLATTAANFVTTNAADYLNDEDIVLTSNGVDLIFTANIGSSGFTSPTIANSSGTLDGIVVNTQVYHGINSNPTLDALVWLRFIDTSTYRYWNSSPISTNNVPSRPDTWQDFTLFGADTPSNMKFEVSLVTLDGVVVKRSLLINTAIFDAATCLSCTIAGDSAYNTIAGEFQNSTIGAGFIGNSIGQRFTGNSADAYFMNNSIDSDFYNNSIGSEFTTNIIGAGFTYNSFGASTIANFLGPQCQQNTVSSLFQENYISSEFNNNRLGSEFQNNIIGSSFIQNTVNSEFVGNTVGIGFYGNVIASYFDSNIIADNFQDNTVTSTFGGYDLTSATHVYGSYTCEVFRRSDEEWRLRYIDNSNVTQIVAVTA